MSTATHYENANFLRELAESLPRIWPNGTRPGLSCCNGWPMKNSPSTAQRMDTRQGGSGQGRHPPHADHG